MTSWSDLPNGLEDIGFQQILMTGNHRRFSKNALILSSLYTVFSEAACTVGLVYKVIGMSKPEFLTPKQEREILLGLERHLQAI
jgi:predicted RNA binding protein YcfA (HicA-like mRNA interferase family)